jgi:hypothetical protein
MPRDVLLTAPCALLCPYDYIRSRNADDGGGMGTGADLRRPPRARPARKGLEHQGSGSRVRPTSPVMARLGDPRPRTPPHGRAVTGRWLSVRMRIALDRAALHGVHLHRYRHWYGTAVQEATGDLRVTQECLRHRHVGSTAGYTMVTSARRAAAVAALPVPRGAHEPGPSRLVLTDSMYLHSPLGEWRYTHMDGFGRRAGRGGRFR